MARTLTCLYLSKRLALLSGGDPLAVVPDPLPLIEGTARLDAVASSQSGQFQITITCAKNWRYTIDTAFDLPDSTPWTNLTSSSRVTQISDSISVGTGRQFYRLVEP